MSVLGELQAVAAKLAQLESRPLCSCCGKGRMVLVEEKPDPNYGALGVLQQILKCDSPDCGAVTVI